MSDDDDRIMRVDALAFADRRCSAQRAHLLQAWMAALRPKAAVPRCEHVTFKAEFELAALSREQKD
jgi:hypothetical protein